MIVRSWHGRATSANSNGYADVFRNRVVPELRAISGFLGATLLRRDTPGGVEFFLLTQWTSMDAIRAFAGPDPEKAVIEPEAAAVLISFDSTVQHYEVVEEFPGA